MKLKYLQAAHHFASSNLSELTVGIMMLNLVVKPQQLREAHVLHVNSSFLIRRIISFLIISFVFYYALPDRAVAQTAPNCRSYFPEYKTAEELSLEKGNISKQRFEEIMALMSNLPKPPSKADAKAALEQFNSKEFQDHLKLLPKAIEELKSQQSNAEVGMANALNLQGNDGTRIHLYCFFSTQREKSINDQNQLIWMTKVTLQGAATMEKYAK